MMAMTPTAHFIAHPSEAAGLKERRREPRLAVQAPVFVRGFIEEPGQPLHEGAVYNLNLHGAYLIVPPWRPFELDEALLLSMRIPPQHQVEFPHPRFAACGCVVRIDQLPPENQPARLGLAVAFIDI